MSISLLQEALSPNQVLVTLLFPENYTFQEKFGKKIFHLNSSWSNSTLKTRLYFWITLFCFTFDCLIMLQQHSLDTGELRKNIQFFYLNFKFVIFYIEDVIFLAIFHAVIDVRFWLCHRVNLL